MADRTGLTFGRRLVMMRENAAMALETLRGNKVRSGLTMLGVFIGVVIVTAVASVLNGFRASIVEEIQSYGTNNLYVYRFPFAFGDPSPSLRKRKELTLDDAWAIRELCPSVKTVSPGVDYPSWRTTARAGKETMEGPVLMGVFPQHQSVLNMTVREGRFFTEIENEHRMDVCAIGHGVAEALFPNVAAIGRSIDVSGNRYKVVGVLEKFKEGPFGEQPREDQLIMIPYNAFHVRYPHADDHFIAVETRPGLLDQAAEEITEVLRRRRKVRWDEENDFEIGSASSIIETFDQIVFGAVAVMFALSSVAFLVGGVGVMNIMLASVKERTSEIGMRKAIGARSRDIRWQFLVEAMTLTGLGGVAGILFTDVLAVILKNVWEGLPIAAPLWARIVGFCGSVSVGLFFGIWPATKAAKLDPIRALHYE
jgi:putative ABC transport system permease protein